VNVGPTEVRAGDLAAALLAQSDALDGQLEAEARARLANGGNGVTVTRPDDEPTVEDQRRWALQVAIQRGYGTTRPTQPRETMVIAGAVVTGERPRMIVWGPDTADRAEAEWRQATRQRENEILISCFGERDCRRAGIL
jgi:hypothetical protein